MKKLLILSCLASLILGHPLRLHAADTQIKITLQDLGLDSDSKNTFVEKTHNAIKAADTIRAYGEEDYYKTSIPDNKLQNFFDQISFTNADNLVDILALIFSETVFHHNPCDHNCYPCDLEVKRMFHKIFDDKERYLLVERRVKAKINNFDWEMGKSKQDESLEQLLDEINEQQKIINDYNQEYDLKKLNTVMVMIRDVAKKVQYEEIY